jgi:hypothetical protein
MPQFASSFLGAHCRKVDKLYRMVAALHHLPGKLAGTLRSDLFLLLVLVQGSSLLSAYHQKQPAMHLWSHMMAAARPG